MQRSLKSLTSVGDIDLGDTFREDQDVWEIVNFPNSDTVTVQKAGTQTKKDVTKNAQLLALIRNHILIRYGPEA